MGRVSKSVTEARRVRLRELLASRAYLPLAEVCAELGISEATARRDLASLEDRNLIRRTHGGALGPYSGALGDFEAFFPTFDQRRQNAGPAKAAIAAWVCSTLGTAEGGRVVFIDSGTTCFAIAEHLEKFGLSEEAEGGITVVTHNLAVAVKLARVEGIEVQVLGGTLLPRQAGLFGDETCRAVSGRRIDVAYMGCEGVDGRGTWNSQKDVVRLQRAAMATAERRVFLVDASKLGQRAPVPLCGWAGGGTESGVDLLVTDATEAEVRAAGIVLEAGRVRTVRAGGGAARGEGGGGRRARGR